MDKLELDVSADLTLESSRDEDRKRRNMRNRQPRPLDIPLKSYVAAANALTYGFAAFPPCLTGRIWEVRRLYVTGPDPFTTISGSVVAYKSAGGVSPDTSTEPSGFGDILLTSGPIPNTAEWGRHALVLRNTEQIVLVLKGLANSQEVRGGMFVWDWDYDSYLCELSSYSEESS